MNLLNWFRRKKQPTPQPPARPYPRPNFPSGISGNSLKDRSTKEEDDYWDRRRREQLNESLFSTPSVDYTPPQTTQDDTPSFGGFGGGDSGGGGASGSWDSGSSDSGSSYDSGSSSYDSGSSDSGGSSSFD